ncbi:hypothetical protein DENSPDRAFT_838846 [Dentipellis sp. KUC8613]|nr:hypothetical protein DENSPDRAFT_838846 [Dentipellis sp. KUC8613]
MVNVRGMVRLVYRSYILYLTDSVFLQTAGISGIVTATGLGVYYMNPNRDPYLRLTPNEKTSQVTKKNRGAKPILRYTIPGDKYPRNQAECECRLRPLVLRWKLSAQ